MAKADKLYGESPRIERGEDGKSEVKKPKKADVGNDGSNAEMGGMPVEERHHHERREMHHRHIHEHMQLHGRHQIEHSHHEGPVGGLHERHQAEHKEMHKRHHEELKHLHARHEKEHGGESEGKKHGAAEVKKIEAVK